MIYKGTYANLWLWSYLALTHDSGYGFDTWYHQSAISLGLNVKTSLQILCSECTYMCTITCKICAKYSSNLLKTRIYSHNSNGPLAGNKKLSLRHEKQGFFGENNYSHSSRRKMEMKNSWRFILIPCLIH